MAHMGKESGRPLGAAASARRVHRHRPVAGLNCPICPGAASWPVFVLFWCPLFLDGLCPRFWPSPAAFFRFRARCFLRARPPSALRAVVVFPCCCLGFSCVGFVSPLCLRCVFVVFLLCLVGVFCVAPCFAVLLGVFFRFFGSRSGRFRGRAAAVLLPVRIVFQTLRCSTPSRARNI